MKTADALSPRRVALFLALCLVTASVAVGYVVHASQRDERSAHAAAVPPATRVTVPAITGGAHVVFRTMVHGEANQLALASLPGTPEANGAADAASGTRAVTELECSRVHFAAGVGLCLTDRGDLFAPHKALFLGPDFVVRHERDLAGLVSRARVSPDGRYGAATVFVTGDSYAEDGAFSTRTTIFEMEGAKVVGDLEQFTVYKDGKRVQAVDFNFWGVTFANDSGRFFATLATGGHTYLVRGDIAARRMDVLRDGVECPSLSPDNTRIAFKQRVDSEAGEFRWRVAVLDLATLQNHAVAETRNVDDQVEWLDDATLLYAVDTGSGPPSTWATPADGSGMPRLFIPDGDSPAVVRTVAR
jgi:hypothetical protein